MTTVADLVKTFWGPGTADDVAKAYTDHMIAVLETHVKPMLAEAFRHGGAEETSDLGPVFTAADHWPEPEEYAARVIAALNPDSTSDA